MSSNVGSNRLCSNGRCNSYAAGHLVHFIQARLVGESPWGWRDAVVTGIEGLTVYLEYLHEVGQPECWHHRSLSDVLEPGAPVRLHERYHVLGCPAGWFSVHISDGLGAIPTPDDTAAWKDLSSPGIVDLSKGAGVATDHGERDDPH